MMDNYNIPDNETKNKEEFIEYKLVMESTSDCIWTSSLSPYRLTMFNKTISNYFRDYYGINIKIGMLLEEMLSEECAKLWVDYYDKAIHEGEFKIEYETKAHKIILSLLISPLMVDGVVKGVSVFGRNITKEIEYKKYLEDSNQKLAQRLRQATNAILKICELRDAYTAGHQKRVAELACAIAQEMGLSGERIDNILLGAMIHDIGKIYIASDTLNKSGKITELEYQILQTHTEYGYDVVKEIDFSNEVPIMVYQHHERLDGSGYPNKLKGEKIILESRILAVADVVEAMNSHRPYRPALGIDVALQEISQYKGIKYDEQVVDACIELFYESRFAFLN